MGGLTASVLSAELDKWNVYNIWLKKCPFPSPVSARKFTSQRSQESNHM